MVNKRIKTEIRNAIRDQLELSRSNRWPIQIIPGHSWPYLVGIAAHYETRGGTLIRHPGAYARKGYSNMVYCRSTVHVFVGLAWVKNLIRAMRNTRPPLADCVSDPVIGSELEMLDNRPSHPAE